MKSQFSQGTASLHYSLFVYREELRRRQLESRPPHTKFMKLGKVKLAITDHLIMNTVRNLGSFAITEVLNLNREMVFKRQLSIKMQKIHTLQKMGVKNIDPDTIIAEL